MKENINPLRRTKMSKITKTFGLALFFFALAGAPLLAQTASSSAAKLSLFKLSLMLGAGIITLAVFIGAFCQAKAISAACEGISRNPLGGHIRFLLIFGLVLIKTLVIACGHDHHPYGRWNSIRGSEPRRLTHRCCWPRSFR
jgi:F-type H+-transporting ATPase subunit c